jgi:hypothetical protein
LRLGWFLFLSFAPAVAGSFAGSLFIAAIEGILQGFFLVFAVSFPFTLVGSVLLSLFGIFSRFQFGTWSDYGVVAFVAAPLGVAMTLFAFGLILELAFIGFIFALLTALAWAALHRLIVLHPRKAH